MGLTSDTLVNFFCICESPFTSHQCILNYEYVLISYLKNVIVKSVCAISEILKQRKKLKKREKKMTTTRGERISIFIRFHKSSIYWHHEFALLNLPATISISSHLISNNQVAGWVTIAAFSKVWTNNLYFKRLTQHFRIILGRKIDSALIFI